MYADGLSLKLIDFNESDKQHFIKYIVCCYALYIVQKILTVVALNT